VSSEEELERVRRITEFVEATAGVELGELAGGYRDDCAALVKRIRELEHRNAELSIERDVFEELLGGPDAEVDFDAVGDALERAVHGPRPEWPRLRQSVADIEATIGEDNFATRAQIDRNGAWLRDVFDSQGLSIAHPDTLYVAIVAQTVLVEMSHNSIGRIPYAEPLQYHVAMLARTFIASVMDYLPAEAKG
jgi:hypothetical protein